MSEEDAQKKTSSLVFIGGTACVWIWLNWAPKFPGDCHFHYFEQLLSLLLMSILQRDQDITLPLTILSNSLQTKDGELVILSSFEFTLQFWMLKQF